MLVNMNFLLKSNPTNISQNIYTSLRALYYSTQPLSSFFLTRAAQAEPGASPVKSGKKSNGPGWAKRRVESGDSTPHNPLQVRIMRSGDPKCSMVSVIEEWIRQGGKARTRDLQTLIRLLRKHNRYAHALQISEWLSDQRSSIFRQADVAIHLDLILNVYGLEAAENYFNKISEASRGYQIYGALLNCYADKKKVGEAETMMERMRDLGFLKTSLPYNVMLNLYSELGEEEKMDVLVKDMERLGISSDIFTFSIHLKFYGLTGNVEEIDKLLMKMESDPLIRMEWNSYVTAVNGYLKAGSTEKALAALKKAEKVVSENSRKSAYEMFITQYAACGSKDDVHRIWNLYKNMGKTYNTGYLCMLSSVIKFDDIDAAERIAEEWKSSENVFDPRIPNLIITVYCKKGLLEKAELWVNKIMEMGKEPNSTTWDRLVSGYVTVGQMVKAIEVVKKALSASKPFENWKPHNKATAECIKYLKNQGDEAAAEELLKTVAECYHYSSAEYNMLVDYINNE